MRTPTSKSSPQKIFGKRPSLSESGFFLSVWIETTFLGGSFMAFGKMHHVNSSAHKRRKLIGSSVCGEVAAFKPSSRACIQKLNKKKKNPFSLSSCRNYMTSNTRRAALDDAPTPTLLLQRPVLWVSDAARSEQIQIPFVHVLTNGGI